jgi:hypothetical protein
MLIIRGGGVNVGLVVVVVGSVVKHVIELGFLKIIIVRELGCKRYKVGKDRCADRQRTCRYNQA